MRLTDLSIFNYKSLKHVEFSPKHFSVIVGPNASGKSNFIDSIDFLSHTYKYGIENAVSIKGGYENIAFRKHRRTKAPIRFEISFTLSKNDLRRLYRRLTSSSSNDISSDKNTTLTITHSFSFKAKGSDIRSEFVISEENLEITQHPDKDALDKTSIFSVTRDINNKIQLHFTKNDIISTYYKKRLNLDIPAGDYLLPSSQSLFISHPIFSLPLYLDKVSNIGTFRFSTHVCKQPGVPAPQPLLSTYGDNLPAVLDWIKRNFPDRWNNILEPMQDILSDLEDITIDYTHTKRLGIYFKTQYSQRPWSVDEISDGTLQALAILTASVDPRFNMIAIEEIENSLHPWIISVLMDRLRLISKKRSVIITTHSPIVIDKTHPNELWITFKSEGETNIKELTTLDKDISKDWENGSYKLSNYLDSGLLPQATPGASI
jgi:predicted ATPase